MIGVAGAGRWGKTIVRVLEELGEPYGLYDPAQDSDFGSFQELAESCLDVVIATPPELHAPLAIQAIASGVDSLFVEKPLATSAGEADAVRRYAESKSVRIAVGHALVTGAPGFQQFTSRPRRVEVFRHGGLAGHHVPAWWDLGPHDVAACLTLLGTPNEVTVEQDADWYHARLYFPDVTAFLTGVRGEGPKRWEFTIDGKRWTPYSEKVEPLRRELEWWLDGGSNVDEAVQVVEVLEGA